ncbi:MAG: glycosyltransferase family 4 protein, partial [Actinomycetota bacterium]
PLVDGWTKLFKRRKRLAAFVRRRTGLPTMLPDLGEHSTFLYVSDCIRSKTETVTPWRPRTSGIVYSGIDPTFLPGPAETPSPWRWRLLYLGRIDERKGIGVAVQALRLLPSEATLMIAGRGDPGYLEKLNRLVRKLGLEQRVHFTVSAREELGDRFRAADVVVFPTIWDEPFGLVPVEAMACGTPVIATGTGGSGEFLRDGVNCVLVEPGDPRALASAVTRVAGDGELRRHLLEGGLRTSEELTVDRLTDVLEAWHVAAAEGYSSRTPSQRILPMT